MPYSFVQYTPGAPTVGPFTVSFPYIEKYQVEVRKNGTLLVVTTDYTWPTTSTVQLNVACATSDVIEIRRNSLRKADGTVGRLVDFENSAKLTESNLDRDSFQCFYLAQEAFDAAANALQTASNVYDAGGKKITNLANGSAPQDAVTYAQLAAAALAPVSPVASSIANTPAGNLSAANVQAALNELQTDIDALAPKLNAALTGTPTAPTAALGTNTTQIATTAFVLANGGTKLPNFQNYS